MKNQITILLSALAVVGFQAHAQVLNGDMLSVTGGVPDNWSLTTAASGSDTYLQYGAGIPAVTANAWEFGDVANPANFPASYDELSQNVATTAGTTYDISFWVSAANDSYLMAYFGATQGENLGNFSTPTWTEYSFDATAAGPSTTLAFYGNNVPSWVGVGDVSVTAVSTPDSASSLALMAMALTGVCGFARRLRRK